MRRSLAMAAVLAATLSTPSFASELTGTLKKISETGTITIGVRDASIPFSYLDNNNQHIGYSLEICDEIVKSIKDQLELDSLEIKNLSVTPATRIPLTLNGTTDLYCGSASNTVERRKQVEFSNTIFLAQPSLLVKKDSGISSLQDMKGKTIVSTSGSTDVRQIHDENREFDLGMRIREAPDHMSSFMMVDTDRADAFQMGDILVAGLVATSQNPDGYNIIRLEELPVEPWALILRRNDPDFKKAVDDVLADLMKSGRAAEYYEKWFDNPIPPHNHNLHLPMSDALKRVFQKPNDSSDPTDYK